tara:strand:- start:1735 stop:1947 length:213 start_codon:yes stop_codon:yes gene_type:complete
MFNLADTNARDFLVWSDPMVKTDDMRALAREYITDNEDIVLEEEGESAVEIEEVAIRSKVNGRWTMTYTF